MNIAELGNYAEELVNFLKDAKAHVHARNWIQKLGFSKDQTYALIPVQTSGRCILGRDPVKKLALYIKENEDNLETEEINELACNFNLAKTGPIDIAQSSLLKLLQKELCQFNANYITLEAIYVPDITCASNKEQGRRQELHEDEGFDCPEFFTLEKVQRRLQKCDTANSPAIQNLIDIIISHSTNLLGNLNYKQTQQTMSIWNGFHLIVLIRDIESCMVYLFLCMHLLNLFHLR